MIRIAINGFGRIGKTFLRAIMADPKARKHIQVLAINVGPANTKDIAHYFKYDTVMGMYPGKVSFKNNVLTIDDMSIDSVLAEASPTKLPWKDLAIDWVVECSGHFTKRDGASQHLAAGAQYVLISAPATGEDATIIPGVNMDSWNPQQRIVSLGSCTTNALIPTVHVLHKHFGISKGFMSTVHAVTNTQALLDVDLGDPRRSRAAMLNIVPTTTGAMDVIGKIFPDLAKVFAGHSIRVPVATVSLLDLSVVVNKKATVDDVHKAFATEMQGSLKGILDCTAEPLVSSDFRGNSHSITIDKTLTSTVDGMVKVFGWYDNEWGYSDRLKDFLLKQG
jgi:glyceraldehyde 3-phosphate dehydrogenase